MEIYELKDGTSVRQIQKVHKLIAFEDEIENIIYDTKIITDGLIESKSVTDEKYDDFSRIDILKTTNLYLKNYTYAIVLTTNRESFYNGKVGGVVDCIKNITLYLRNLNDKETLKTAKEVIKRIKQNSKFNDFSMNSLLREDNNDFIFDVLDKNIYLAKKKVNKNKKYRLDDLYVVWNKNDKDINYLLCTYNPLQNYYVEVLTNTVIRLDDDIEVCYFPSLNTHSRYNHKVNYYELIHLYNKLRNASIPSLENKRNWIDNDKKTKVKIK